MDDIGKRLKEIRQEWKLTQKEFGEKLGLKWSQVKDIEIGRVKLKPPLAKLIYSKMGYNPNWLLTGEGDKEDVYYCEYCDKLIPEEQNIITWNGKIICWDCENKRNKKINIPKSGETFLAETSFIESEQGSTIHQEEKPITSSQVSDIVEKAIASAIKRGIVKIANPTPGIKRPLIRLAQCGTPVKIAYDTGELISIDSKYEYIDMVVLTEGDSMKEEYIPPGAMVYIKKQNYCESGQVVLIANHDIPDEPMLALKKAKDNGKEIIFVNGQGKIVPLGEKIEILGVVKHVMIDF